MVPPPANGGIVQARGAMARLAAAFGPALGSVFLISNPWIGLLLWLAIAQSPRLAGFALLGLAIALGGQQVLGIEDDPRVQGSLRSNVILATISAGWLMEATLYPLQVQVAIAVVVAVVAFVLAAAVLLFLRARSLPPLLWGYGLTAGAMFMLFPVGTSIAAQHYTWWLIDARTIADWTTLFFSSLGSLAFSPSVGAGIIMSGAILLWSRVAFVAGVIGWLAGALTAIGAQQLGLVFYWLPAAHNFFVAGMALGAYYLLPGYASLVLAALAGAGASLCAMVLLTFVPAFAYLPLASGMTIWLALATVSLARDDREFWRNTLLQFMPEEAWWREAFWARRLGRREPLLVVPVPGIVKIAQGFDGPLSHTGHLRHALDFVRPPGSSSPADSIWNAPVVAPAAGVVESVRNNVPDNPLGLCNFADSWGNFVCIRLDQGGWALLAHFRQWSIVVRPGTRVEIGSYLGAAGNSGRSPVPHVHLQVQAGREPGTRTVPFRLANLQSSTMAGNALLHWEAATVPAANSSVMSATPQPAVHTLLTGFAPGSAVWTVDQQGTVPRAFRERNGNIGIAVATTLDADGCHRLCSGRGRLTALAAPDAWRILEQVGEVPLLELMALAAPSVPYAAQPGMHWSDIAPVIPSGVAQWTKLPFAPYQARPFIYTRTTCLSVPTQERDGLRLETVATGKDAALPSAIICTFHQVRGLTRIEAVFARGSAIYNLMSFTPSLPF
ncbi:MAG: urea transporter [Proteobacteria bacterium]|nr:urea transporter [Pseudomonadota bacterium]